MNDAAGSFAWGERRRKGRRPPPKLSRTDFERAALRHLERYPSSAAGLRAVLGRRAERSRAHHGGPPEEVQAIIEGVVSRMADLGFVDDRRYGRALARRLRARGNSLRRIAARLREKGISGPLREELLDEAGEPGAELEAARTYARRRGLGAYRRGRGDRVQTEDDASGAAEAICLRARRELAALARAGFAFEVARQALDVE